jgi:Host cell surface-exposed lipoprotein
MKRTIATLVAIASLVLPTAALADTSAATPGQNNARRSAESYLQYAAFSRSGLIAQLKFEGFTTAQATYAVTVLHPNWSREAALSAKEYLQYQGFSRSGLIAQLRFEGYTLAQATYGVNRTGL